jgi:hypothetical protein
MATNPAGELQELHQPVSFAALAFILEATATSAPFGGAPTATLQVVSFENMNAGWTVGPDGEDVMLVLLVVEFRDEHGRTFFAAATPGSSAVAAGNTRDEAVAEWGDF